MTSLPEPCLEEIRLAPAEGRQIGAMSAPDFHLEQYQYCYLEIDHDGPHWAYTAETRTQDGCWMRWDANSRELVAWPYCDAEDGNPDPVKLEVCGLPDEHVGLHAFELARRPRPADPGGIWLTEEQSMLFR